MGNKEMVDSMIEMIERMNLDYYPFSIIIPAVFAVYLLINISWAYSRPGVKSSAALKTGLALIYIYAGASILSGLPILGPSAIEGALSLWIISAFLFWSLGRKNYIFTFPEEWDLRILSTYFILHGLFIYPIVEVALGFRWPGIVIIGQECPTTILLIGLLIGSIKRTNKILMLILSAFAFFWGGYVSLSGATFDWFYSIAGLAGLVMTFKYWK